MAPPRATLACRRRRRPTPALGSSSTRPGPRPGPGSCGRRWTPRLGGAPETSVSGKKAKRSALARQGLGVAVGYPLGTPLGHHRDTTVTLPGHHWGPFGDHKAERGGHGSIARAPPRAHTFVIARTSSHARHARHDRRRGLPGWGDKRLAPLTSDLFARPDACRRSVFQFVWW